MRTTLPAILLLVTFAGVYGLEAQRTNIPDSSVADDAVAVDIAKLAGSLLTTYKDPYPSRDLDIRFRLQIAAGEYDDAAMTIGALLRTPAVSSDQANRLAAYQMYASAKANRGVSFDDAFREIFQRRLAALDNRLAFALAGGVVADVAGPERDLKVALERRQRNRDAPVNESIALVRQYVLFTAFRDIQPLVRPVIAQDHERRYVTQDDVLIRTTDGATISAVVVRPRDGASRLPAAFMFTIYASESIPDEARRAASYGYAGVVGFTRGKGRSPDEPVPYEHDGEDARAVIDWIVKQPWSDGTVGMYGGSYNGFTQWAAAKDPPPALKTIVPYVAAIPGLGLPMENNVFLNANYGWAFYVTNNRYLDEQAYYDGQRWSSLNDRWYASGRPYQEYDGVDGTPNKWLHRWLAHPAFDRYWQAMTAYGRDFSRIRFPVLSITGYYDDGQISALQYVREHYKYNPNAQHYLVIGPWDHVGSQASTKPAVLRGYAIDPVAQVNTPELTFQWLDYVMRGGAKPELLKDRINYQVMGANTWKHASSIDAMHNDVLSFYLTDEKDGPYYKLASRPAAHLSAHEQTVDFADRRTETNNYYPAPIVGKRLDLSSGYTFISEPFDTPVSVAGTMSGVLRVEINKKDMDVGAVLYEMMPNGDLFHLTYFIGRASFAKDMTTRHLLTPGKVETIPFDRTRLVSRRLSAGSRLLIVLDVNKNRRTELNYGTGRDVKGESLADATIPLRVKWRTDSVIRVPIWR